MRTLMALGLCFVVSAGLSGGSEKDQPKHGAEGHVLIKPGDLKWGPAPPSLPAGAQAAVLAGDPGKEGAFTLRVKMPDGYKVPTHWHPTDENVTVLKGTLLVNAGDKLEAKHAVEMPPGSFMRMPKEMRHHVVAKGETILQVHGTGPFVINYVHATDDPRNKDKK